MTTRGLDLHTRIFVELVKYQFDHLEPRTLADLADIWPPRGLLRVEPNAELGVDVGTDDYEEASLGSFAKWAVRQLNRLPRRDVRERWESPEEAARVLAAMFAPRLRTVVPWSDPTSDEALVILATQGLAAHMLEHVSGSRYAVDLAFMLDYRVRSGFERVGARLELSLAAGDRLTPTSIEWARGTSEPGDDDWPLAKLAFRVAVANAATVRDHAVRCHFLPSNSFVVATRTKLPNDHPVRALLRAFQFRTPAINAGALVTLIPENAIFHRLFAFEWEGLTRLYEEAKSGYRMRTFPAELAERGVADLPGYAYGEDGLGLWRCGHALATRYLDAVGFIATPLDDPDIAAFHRQLRRNLPKTAEVPAIDTRAGLADLLAIQIFCATGWHEQVGGAIGDYLARPDFVVPTMVAGRTLEDCLPSRQTMVQGFMLGVLTNFSMPSIRENFAPLVPERARPVVYRWLTDLGEHGKRVDAANARRAQPMLTFHPDKLEISVSI